MFLFSFLTAAITSVIPAGTPMVTVSQLETVIGEDGAVILWPSVQGDVHGTGRINEILDYENVVGESLAETTENYRLHRRGIIGSSFQVKWSDPHYLDLEITVETLNEYPSSMVFKYLFDLETGEEVTPEELFVSEKIPELVQLCDRMLQVRTGNNYSDDYSFTESNLNDVGMRRGGIVFYYDFNNPLTAAIARPEGFLFLSWSEINDYLLPDLRR